MRNERKATTKATTTFPFCSLATHATVRVAAMPPRKRMRTRLRATKFDDLPEDVQLEILRLALFEDADADEKTRKNALRVECLKRPAVVPTRTQETPLDHDPTPSGIMRAIDAAATAARLCTVSRGFRTLAKHERLWEEPLGLFQEVYGPGYLEKADGPSDADRKDRVERAAMRQLGDGNVDSESSSSESEYHVALYSYNETMRDWSSFLKYVKLCILVRSLSVYFSTRAREWRTTWRSVFATACPVSWETDQGRQTPVPPLALNSRTSLDPKIFSRKCLL